MPLLRKIYDTHKKWVSPQHKENAPKKSAKKSETAKSKNTDVVLIQKSVEHPYENVDYKKQSSIESNANYFLDSSIESNITVVEVDYDGKNASEEDNNKLRIVINNFDKILDEFSNAKKETKIPKLQKAKTCSIIESKCILKKSLSQPLDAKNINNDNSLQTKTKSMSHLDTDDQPETKTPTKSKPRANGEVITECPKVGEVIKMMNAISSSESAKKPPKTPTPPAKTLPRAVSSCDISSKKAVSKIPVKASLRKSFPSTPLGLDVVDRGRGSVKLYEFDEEKITCEKTNKSFSKSVQNLSMKPTKKEATEAANKTVTPRMNGRFAKSVQNLAKNTTKKKFEVDKETVYPIDNTPAKSKQSTAITPENELLVKSTVQKFESTKVDSAALKKKRYDTYKKEKPVVVGVANTFGAKKTESKAKFVQHTTTSSNKPAVSRSDTYKKPKPNESTPKRLPIEDQKSSTPVVAEKKEVHSKNKINQLISNFESKSAVQHAESEIPFNFSKIKDYSSDDNSDDSGNISNEVELDCEDNSSGMVSPIRNGSSSEDSLIEGNSFNKQTAALPVSNKKEVI